MQYVETSVLFTNKPTSISCRIVYIVHDAKSMLKQIANNNTSSTHINAVLEQLRTNSIAVVF